MAGQNDGFPLGEAVVVAAILAVVAAVAVPQFGALQRDTRMRAVETLASEVRAASALAHSVSALHLSPPEVTVAGTTVRMVNGYPDASELPGLVDNYEGFSFDGEGRFTRDDARRPASCFVKYSNASGSGARPGIVAATAGC